MRNINIFIFSLPQEKFSFFPPLESCHMVVATGKKKEKKLFLAHYRYRFSLFSYMMQYPRISLRKKFIALLHLIDYFYERVDKYFLNREEKKINRKSMLLARVL